MSLFTACPVIANAFSSSPYSSSLRVSDHSRKSGMTIRKRSPSSRLRKAETIAKVCHRCGPSNRYLISLGHEIVNDDAYVGKGSAEGSAMFRKLLRTVDDRVWIREPVGASGLDIHLWNRRQATLIPNFFKPAPNELLILLRHRTSRARSLHQWSAPCQQRTRSTLRPPASFLNTCRTRQT